MVVEKKRRLDAAVREKFNLSWGKARMHVESGKISVDGVRVTDLAFEIGSGQVIALQMNAPRVSREQNRVTELSRDSILFVDAHVIVINKPAGVSTVPFNDGEFTDAETDTLEHRVSAHLGGARVRVVHRLDRDTSGIVVFARNKEAERTLMQQFRFHQVLRRYRALVHGKIESQVIRSHFVEDRGDGIRGSLQYASRGLREEAKAAVTHVTALEYLNGMTFIECRLETGRTHQIRIHLSEAGHPLVGEKLYVREYRGTQIEAPRQMLHAFELGFNHPVRGDLQFEVPLPTDFQKMLSR